MNSNMDETLNSIYLNNLEYLARWNTCLANHVSMAATAMYLMKDRAKISPRKISADANIYTKMLSPKRMNSAYIKLGKLSWSIQRQLLGHDDLQESWQVFFQKHLISILTPLYQFGYNAFGGGLARQRDIRLFDSTTLWR
jgi:hypothetical protein